MTGVRFMGIALLLTVGVSACGGGSGRRIMIEAFHEKITR